MKSMIVTKVIETLYNSEISDFIFKCETENATYQFELGSKIKLVMRSKLNNTEISSEYSRADELNLEDMTPVSIEEIRYSNSGLLLERKTRNIYREADLFLVLFKVLKENAVFIIQNKETVRVCYYISSRVMYIKFSDRVNELVETNLFKLFNSMPGASIVMFSSLPRRYSCKDFYTEMNFIADRDGKLFRNNKEGVGVR